MSKQVTYFLGVTRNGKWFSLEVGPAGSVPVLFYGESVVAGLQAMELRILELLVTHNRRYWETNEIVDQVRGLDAKVTHPLSFVSKRVRILTGKLGDEKAIIHERGKGYRFAWRVAREQPKPGSLLTLDAWSSGRYERWIDGSPIPTDCSRDLQAALLRSPGKQPWHGILVGPIASGKSTAIHQALHAVAATTRFASVVVLPLSLDFHALNETWSRAKAIEGFSSTLTQVPVEERAATLVVIEDAHESAHLDELPWTAQGSSRPEMGCFRDCSILLTCRSQAAEGLLADLKARSSVEPKRFEADVAATARNILREIVRDHRQIEQARTMFDQSGFSLVALTYALRQWDQQGREGKIDMTLAHEAVFSELDRIAGALSSSDESSLQVRSLAILWMIGGLDAPVEIELLRKYFGVELNIHKFWKRLVDLRELAPYDPVSSPARRYVSLRHPAWGQLVMHAMDEQYRENAANSGIPTDLVKRFLGSPIGAEFVDIFGGQSRRNLVPSVCLLFSLQHAKRKSPDEQRFTEDLSVHCSGRFLYREFVAASLLMVEVDRRLGSDALSVCERQLAIASNARRVSPIPWTANESRENLLAARTAFRAAMETLRSAYGDNLGGYSKRGYALYEDSYYDYRFGRFEDAVGKLRLSIEAEAEGGEGRKPFASMSRTRLSRVLADQGLYDEALVTAHQALKELDGTNSDRMVHRFRGNTLHAIGRILLCQRRLSDAANYIAQVGQEFEKANVVVNLELTQARMSLANGNSEEALRYAERFRSNSVIVNDDEMWEQYYRVVGDAALLEGKREEATRNYTAVLPPSLNELGPEALIAQSRIKAIQNGLSGTEILSRAAI